MNRQNQASGQYSQYGQQPGQSSCYQQPPQNPGQQSQYGQQQQPQYGQQSLFSNPNVQILSRGSGISDRDCQEITSACIEAQEKQLAPLANVCIQKIKEKLRGDWYVFVCPQSETNYDFYLSFVDGGKFLTFRYGTNEFHVYGIKI